MPLFGKKKEPFPNIPSSLAPPTSPLIDQISSMMQQGMSNSQIIQTLQNQGYKSNDIFNAMSAAEMGQQQYGGGPLPMQDMGMPPGMPPEIGPMTMPPPSMAPPGMPPETSKENIEEIAEAIIEEKWKDLLGDVNKVVEWKRIVDTRLDKLETQIKDLKTNFETLHKAILGRISEYDKNLTDVGVEIKAMEKVFQKILPTFTENVNKLSRMVGKEQ